MNRITFSKCVSQSNRIQSLTVKHIHLQKIKIYGINIDIKNSVLCEMEERKINIQSFYDIYDVYLN